MTDDAAYYRTDLALVHDRGFSFHADACAPGVLELLGAVDSGVVLELGCGSGHLTRHLVAAGHRVIATDASPAMVDIARAQVPGTSRTAVLRLPEDPLPPADAVVSVGHVLSYLPSEDAIFAALVAIAGALAPGGVLALDLCDLTYGRVRRDAANAGRAGDDWAIVTQFSAPSPDRFVRDITVFVRDADGRWRRDDERHVNVLVDTTRIPALLAPHGVTAQIGHSFGDHPLPEGLVAIIGRKHR